MPAARYRLSYTSKAALFVRMKLSSLRILTLFMATLREFTRQSALVALVPSRFYLTVRLGSENQLRVLGSFRIHLEAQRWRRAWQAQYGLSLSWKLVSNRTISYASYFSRADEYEDILAYTALIVTLCLCCYIKLYPSSHV